MRIKVLGCSGGIGSGLATTSFLVDHDILLDAGTGVGKLSFDELKHIDHVFLTHSHLDHIASLPFLIDTVGFVRNQPLTVYALPEVITALQGHIFNWIIWPDFTHIPNHNAPWMRFLPVELGKTITLGERRITPLPANHTVPACGYQIDNGTGSWVFTGDTTTNDELWPIVNNIANLRYLLIETAFCNREKEIAIASKHLCPSLLVKELAKLERPADIYITHLKPGEIELTMQEIRTSAAAYNPNMLQPDQEFVL